MSKGYFWYAIILGGLLGAGISRGINNYLENNHLSSAPHDCIEVPLGPKECDNLDAWGIARNPKCLETDRILVLCGEVKENK